MDSTNDIELITVVKSFIVPVHLSNQALMLYKYCCKFFYSFKPVFPLPGISVLVYDGVNTMSGVPERVQQWGSITH
jgi:hypothetical protein